MSQASQFFNNVLKSELANFVALSAIFKSHDLETKELHEAFVTYAKLTNELKVIVLKQLEQTESVDAILEQLKVKVQDDAEAR